MDETTYTPIETVTDVMYNSLADSYWCGSGFYGVDKKYKYWDVFRTKVYKFDTRDELGDFLLSEECIFSTVVRDDYFPEYISRIDVSDELFEKLHAMWRGAGQYRFLVEWCESLSFNEHTFQTFDDFAALYMTKTLSGRNVEDVVYTADYVEDINKFQVGQFYMEDRNSRRIYLCTQRTDKTVMFVGPDLTYPFRKHIKVQEHTYSGQEPYEYCTDKDSCQYGNVRFAANFVMPFCETTAKMYEEWAGFICKRIAEEKKILD